LQPIFHEHRFDFLGICGSSTFRRINRVRVNNLRGFNGIFLLGHWRSTSCRRNDRVRVSSTLVGKLSSTALQYTLLAQ